jgi:hypothetical protein
MYILSNLESLKQKIIFKFIIVLLTKLPSTFLEVPYIYISLYLCYIKICSSIIDSNGMQNSKQ